MPAFSAGASRAVAATGSTTSSKSGAPRSCVSGTSAASETAWWAPGRTRTASTATAAVARSTAMARKGRATSIA